MINLKSDLENKSQVNLKYYKKYLRNNHSEKKKVNCDLNISNAKMLNCSEQTVSYLKTKWKCLGIVQFVRVFRIVQEGKNFKGCNKYVGGKTCISGKVVCYEFLYSKVLLGEYLTQLFASGNRRVIM